MAIDAKDYIEQRDELLQYYSKYHSRVRDVLRYYELEVEATLPEGFDQHTPPSARSIPEALAAALHPTDFAVSVEPKTEKKGHVGAEAQAAKLEPFHYDCLTRLDRAYGDSILLELEKSAIITGMYIGKGPALNPDLWGDKPVRKGQSPKRYDALLKQWENERKTTLPLDFFILSPLEVLPDPAVFMGRKPKYVFESYKRLASEVKGYGIATDKKDFEEVEWIEYWDAQNRVYIVRESGTNQGQIVKVIKNPYAGSPYPIPYHFGFCSLGSRAVGRKPENKAVGVMWPILSNLSAEIRQVSMLDIVAQIYGVPATAKDGDFEETPVLTPGAVNPSNVKLRELIERKPGAGQEIMNVLGLIYDHREQATYQKTLAAVRIEGVSTGIQQQLLTIQAYKRYEPLLHTLEETWGNVGSQIAWIVENIIDEPVNEHIKPDEIGGYYACNVEFDVVEALERAAKIEEMSALRGFYSDKTLRQHFNFIPEAEDEEEQLVQELLAKHPAILDALAQRTAQRLVGAQALEGAAEGGTARRFTPAPGFQGFGQPQGGGRGLG